ncbi:MAG TPA: response regulator transcription factor [Niabella sp.]|jgi:DNA-binding NarL/FixJ family response regulator|nr:response regulator transcription factor [Niabella sp.]
MAITIGLVEDHSEFRKSLEYLISPHQKFKIIWSCSSVEEALNKYEDVNVILLDINLPGVSGIEAITLFKQKYPVPKIIMLTILEDDKHVLEAIKKGADGYILKKANPQKILDGIENVQAGGAALTPMIARQIMAFLRPDFKQEEQYSSLTPREKEILTLLAMGVTTEVIGEKLFISAQTVRNHIKNIYEKLQVHSRAQMVAKAYKDKLI